MDVLDKEDIEKDDKNSPLQDSTWTVEDKPFNVRLPVVLRVGGAYQDGATVITYDYVQGFSEGAWASTRPRVSFGTEWRGLGWLPLRMGVIFGGRIGFGTSAGLGLRLGGFAMDFGFLSQGFFLPSTSKGLTIALEMGVGL